MFQEKTNKIGKNASQKLIYTTNFIARFVSCVFADNTKDELKGYDVEQLSEALANSGLTQLAQNVSFAPPCSN